MARPEHSVGKEEVIDEKERKMVGMWTGSLLRQSKIRPNQLNYTGRKMILIVK